MKEKEIIIKEKSPKKIKLARNGRPKKVLTKTRATLVSGLASIVSFVMLGFGSGSGLPPVVQDEAPKIEIVFDANTGGTSANFKLEIDANGFFKAPTLEEANLTVPESYKFLGWSLSPNAKTASFQPGAPISVSESNLRIYAVWELIEESGSEEPEILPGVVNLVVEGGYDLVMQKGEDKGGEFVSLVLGGISATAKQTPDSEEEDITNKIFIESVNGEAVEEGFNWNEIASASGAYNVLIAVENPYATDENSKFAKINRVVTVVSVPEIYFNGNKSDAPFTVIDNETIKVEKDTSIDLLKYIILEDEYATLSKDDISVTAEGVVIAGIFKATEYKDYVIKFTVENDYGYFATLNLVVQVIRPFPHIGVAEGSNLNIIAVRPSGNALKATALDSIFADDGEGNDATDKIVIDSVNGAPVDELFNWDETASGMGNVLVQLKITNRFDKTNYLSRIITIVDKPEIVFNEEQFIVENGRLRVFQGEEFDYASALSVKDDSDENLTVQDIVVTGSVDTSVVGLYTISFDVVNKFGVAAQTVVYEINVRLKGISDYTAVEAYNKIQEKMYNSYYRAEARDGTFNTSWGAAAKYDGMSAVTINNKDTYSYMEAYNGYILTFSVGIVSTFNDLRRAVQIDYDKNTQTAVLKRDLRVGYYTKSFSTTGDVWGKTNGLINAGFDKTINNWDMADYENWFGRPLMQDSNFYVTENTLINIPTIQSNGDGTYTIEFKIKHDGVRSSAGVKGRIDFLENLQNNEKAANDTGGVRPYGDDSGMYATMTYKIDGNFRVISKRVQEQYNWYAASAWYWFRTDFTTTYDYSLYVQPSL